MSILLSTLNTDHYPWGAYNYITTTSTADAPSFLNYDKTFEKNSNNIIKIKPFNCKKCGAVGQYELCSYCGSAEE